jgi:hypothetical protein
MDRVSEQKISRMGKNGMRNIVKKSRERLFFVFRKIPNYRCDSQAVIEPGIRDPMGIIFAVFRAASLGNIRQPSDDRAVKKWQEKFRLVFRIDIQNRQIGFGYELVHAIEVS